MKIKCQHHGDSTILGRSHHIAASNRLINFEFLEMKNSDIRIDSRKSSSSTTVSSSHPRKKCETSEKTSQNNFNKLQHQRCVAVDLMLKLLAFCPRVVGSIIDDTFVQERGVDIVLYTKAPTVDLIVKTLEREKIDVEIGVKTLDLVDGNSKVLPCLQANFQNYHVDIVVFEGALKGSLALNADTGRPIKRFSVKHLLALVYQQDALDQGRQNYLQ